MLLRNHNQPCVLRTVQDTKALRAAQGTMATAHTMVLQVFADILCEGFTCVSCIARA
jgi:hypothetical protein